MDEDDLYTDVTQEIPATKWHWSFLGMRTLCLGANVANAFRAFLSEVAGDVGSHANYQMERDEFESSAGRELEMILEGTEEN